MSKLTLTLLPLLLLAVPASAQEAFIPWANKFFTSKGETPPPVILQDFGTLPKGTVRTYRFQMQNIYAVPMTVREPRASCTCVSVIEYTGIMNARETGHIDIKIDTSRVEGKKEVRIPVTFEGRDAKSGEGFQSTALLEVRAISRPDIEIRPGVVQFGTVPAGQTSTQAVRIIYSGRQRDWTITDAQFKKELLDVKVVPLQVRGAIGFEVLASLKPGAPAGRIDDQIVLKTNDPVAPVLSLTVTGEVQAKLNITNGDQLKMGGVERGKSLEKIITVVADKPFKVKTVEGQGDGVSVVLRPLQANKVQPLTITFAPEKVGPVKKVLTITTDAGDSVKLTVEGIGKEPAQ